MLKNYGAKVIAVPLLLLLAACGGNNGQQDPAGEIPTPEVIGIELPAGGSEIVFAQWSNPPSLDPHGSNDTVSSEVQLQIFEGLTNFDANGNVVGQLAESFEAIEPTVWEFRLRQGVTFHDGEPLTAEAVYLSISRLLAPETASPRAFILEMVDEIVIVDDHTIHFITPFAFAALPAHLAHPAGLIISPASIAAEAAGQENAINDHPIGTGPFVFYSRIHGQEIVMTRNDNYWGNHANVETLRFLVIPEPAQRTNMLLTGEVNTTVASAIDAQVIRDTDGLELMEIYSSRQNYVGFNINVAPFDDIRVRQAIAMVLDLEGIIYGVAGMGIPAAGPLSPAVAGSAAAGLSPLTGTVEEARELLAEAGFPDGFSTTISLGAGRPIEEGLTAQILQANLLSIGINATINEIEWGAFLDYTEVGNHEIFILGWTVVTGDADAGMFPLFHTTMHGAQGNRTFYSNPVVDDLLEQARMETNVSARNDLYRQITEILIYEVPMISTFYPTFAVGINGIEGLFVNFNAMPFFYTATLTN